jgi:hypothetical protein
METGGERSSGAKLPARWRRTPPSRLRPHRSMREHDERLGTLEKRRTKHTVRQGKRGIRQRTLEPRQRRLRHSNRPRTPGPQRCANPHDLKPRPESRRPRRQEPGGQIVRKDAAPTMRKPYQTLKRRKDDSNPVNKHNLGGIARGVPSRSKTRKRVYLGTIETEVGCCSREPTVRTRYKSCS